MPMIFQPMSSKYLLFCTIIFLSTFHIALSQAEPIQAEPRLAEPLPADPIQADLSRYEPQTGLTAEVEGDNLLIRWEGENESELQLSFSINQGVPTIRELLIRPSDGAWQTIATDVVPEYRVVSGLRRVTQQQTEIGRAHV